MAAYPLLPQAFLATPIAHRGLHDRAKGAIENSRAAIRAAVEAGYGVELDIQLSADGEAMVFHDDELNRLTEADGLVRAFTAARLGETALRESEEGVPTLAEILAIVAGRAPLLIEAKDQSRAMTEVDGTLERRAAALLAGYEGPVALMSFNPHSVAHLRNAAPDIPRGRVSCAFGAEHWPELGADRRAALARLDDLDALECAFISHFFNDLTDDAVTRTKAMGRPVLTWTVRSKEEETRARKVADNITFEGYVP